MKIQEAVSLAPLTTFRIGGPARYFASIEGEADLESALGFARERALPLFVLGGGSNLLVSDSGFSGLVLHIAGNRISRQVHSSGVQFQVSAGADWDAFVAQSVSDDCAGLECLSGIPGTVGGTPVQNVGAYGQEVAETIASVRVYDLQERGFRDLTNADCGFGYRSSIFNSSRRGRYIVLAVTFLMQPHGRPRVAYAELQKALWPASSPTLDEVRRTVREIRRGKGMLIVQGDPDARSAGSFFKNPVVSEEQYQLTCSRAEDREVPRFAAASGTWKIPAAWLIEQAGFQRGYSRGRAGISSKHTLAIVNRGGATAAEILALKDEIQQRVRGRFGILLQPEPVFVGFDCGDAGAEGKGI